MVSATRLPNGGQPRNRPINIAVSSVAVVMRASPPVQWTTAIKFWCAVPVHQIV